MQHRRTHFFSNSANTGGLQLGNINPYSPIHILILCFMAIETSRPDIVPGSIRNMLGTSSNPVYFEGQKVL
jgi:hypothetical protein